MGKFYGKGLFFFFGFLFAGELLIMMPYHPLR